MKILFRSLLIVAFALCLSCDDKGDSTFDIATGETLNGVALKTIERTPNLSLGDPAARAMFKVMVIDQNFGNETREVKVYARIQTASSVIFEERLFATIPNSAFVRDGQYPSVSVSASKADIEAFFSTTITAPQSRRFRFRLEAITNDGRLYTDTNSNGVIRTGSFFSSPFQYTYNFAN